jgi:hypothetical protein
MIENCLHFVNDLLFVSNKDIGINEDAFAQMPTPVFERDQLCIYLTSRDADNNSFPIVIEFDLNRLKVTNTAHRIPLSNGSLGNFDDAGVMPSSIIDTGSRYMMYYIGWNRSITTPYRLSIGLAVKNYESDSFTKYSNGPILDRSIHNPYFVTTPHVTLKDKKFSMLLSTGTSWVMHDGKLESVYSLTSAKSEDGINWHDFRKIRIGSEEENCVARPVEFESHVYFSERPSTNFRKSNSGYRIKAELLDQREKKFTCSLIWNKGHDNDHDRSYANPFKFNGKRYLMYNGEKFGKYGFYIAEETLGNN